MLAMLPTWRTVSSESVTDVRQREQRFHDALADSLRPADLGPRPLDELEEAMFERLGTLAGRDVLDLGCGIGDLTLHALQRGATLTALELSPRLAEITRERAAALGGESCRVVVAPAEATGLPDGSFDVILGRWIIHHLDVEAAAREVSRMLRPGGTAMFIETSSLNPLLRFARNHLVGRFGIPRFGTPDEHPLGKAEYAMLSRTFKTFRLDAPFFYFFEVGHRHLPHRLKRPAVRACARWLDRQVWRWLPPLRRYSFWVLIEGRA